MPPSTTIVIPTNRYDGSIAKAVESHIRERSACGHDPLPILVSDQSPPSINTPNPNSDALQSLSKKHDYPIMYVGQGQFAQLAEELPDYFRESLKGPGYANSRARGWLLTPAGTQVVQQFDDDESSLGFNIPIEFSRCIGKTPRELKVRYKNSMRDSPVWVVGGPYLGKLGLQVDCFKDDPEAFKKLSVECEIPTVYMNYIDGHPVGSDSFRENTMRPGWSFNGGNVAISKDVFSNMVPPFIGQVHGDDMHVAYLVSAMGSPILRYELPVNHEHAPSRSTSDWVTEYWTRPINGTFASRALVYGLLKASGAPVDLKKPILEQFYETFGEKPVTDIKQMKSLFQEAADIYCDDNLFAALKPSQGQFYTSVAQIFGGTNNPALQGTGTRLMDCQNDFMRSISRKISNYFRMAPSWSEVFNGFQDTYNAYDFSLQRK